MRAMGLKEPVRVLVVEAGAPSDSLETEHKE
jgi:hypothetical protein